jgi:hypothetical protein
MNDLAQPQGKVCADVNRGHDLENRQIGHGSQGVRRQRESRGSGPRSFQDKLLKVIFDKLADPRTTVDVRNDLEKEVRLLESGLDLRQVGFAVLVSHRAGCYPQRTVIQRADERIWATSLP